MKNFLSVIVSLMLLSMQLFANNGDSTAVSKQIKRAFNKGDIVVVGGSTAFSFVAPNPSANLDRYMNTVIIGARYQIERQTSLGLLFSWAFANSCTDNVIDGINGNTIATAKQRIDDIHILFSYENFWLNRGSFALYSGIDLGLWINYRKDIISNGVTLQQMRGIYGEDDGYELNGYGGLFADKPGTNYFPGIQLHVFGIKFKPSKKVSVFGDLSLGTVGILNFGVQYLVN